jgi:hypothetical protein
MVLAGRAWWAIGADQLGASALFAADAVSAARRIGDPEAQLLADSALAAATAIAEPSQHATERFLALARQRARGPSHRTLTDEPDLMALAARLALAGP